MVHHDDMSTRPLKTATGEPAETLRASVSFPEIDYRRLEKIADEKKVSVAWVVREAVNEYLSTLEGAKK